MSAQPLPIAREFEEPRDEESKTLAPRVKPGGFWKRAIASVIDNLVISVIQLPFLYGVRFLSTGTTQLPMDETTPVTLPGLSVTFFYLISFAITWAYYGYFYKSRGASPGKMAMNLRVVNMRDGTYLTYSQTFLREIIGKLVSSLLLMIGYLMVAIRRDKRALHDLIAGTQVIDES